MVAISPIATLRTIDKVRESLIDAFGANGPIEVDCSQVEDADLSLVQVLEAAARQAAATSRPFRLLPGPSPILVSLLRRAGLSAAGTDGWHGLPETGEPGR